MCYAGSYALATHNFMVDADIKEFYGDFCCDTGRALEYISDFVTVG